MSRIPRKQCSETLLQRILRLNTISSDIGFSYLACTITSDCWVGFRSEIVALANSYRPSMHLIIGDLMDAPDGFGTCGGSDASTIRELRQMSKHALYSFLCLSPSQTKNQISSHCIVSTKVFLLEFEQCFLCVTRNIEESVSLRLFRLLIHMDCI